MFRTFLAIAALSAAPVFAEPAKPPPDKMSDEMARRYVAFFDKLTAIVVDSKQDCARMAAGVNAHVDANQPLLKQVADAKAHNKALPQQVKDRIAKKSAEQLAPAMMARCSNDRAVMSAFLRIKASSAK